MTPRQEMERRIVALGVTFRAPDKLMKKMLVMAEGFVEGAVEEGRRTRSPVTEQEACEQAVTIITQTFKEELPGWLTIDDGQHK
jgi:hypothetical protein